MSRTDGIDEFNPDTPIPHTLGEDRFWQTLRPWWLHSSKFAMAESERAGKQAAAVEQITRREETFTQAIPPLEPSVPYPALVEDTLDQTAEAIHCAGEELDQPACDADADADPGLVMWITPNPVKVTCPACLAIADAPLELRP